MNVQTILNDAATLAGSKATGQDLSGDQNALYLRTLNRLLHSWLIENIDLGFSDVDATDELYIEQSEELAVVYNLASLIYEAESRPINQAVYMRAGELYSTLQAKHLERSEAEMPRALTRSKRFNIING